MAINVDQVYKAVLSILNKEQRGYITPTEFNKIATQTQISLLDQAFMIYNKELVMQDNNLISEGYANLPSKTKDKIDAFYKTGTLDNFTTGTGTLPTDIYKIIEVSNSNVNIEEVDKGKLSFLNSSPLTKPTVNFPIYYKTPTQMVITPTTITNPTISYIKIPTAPRWGYTINATYGTNVYDNRTFVATGLVINKTLTIPTVTADENGTTAALATTSSGSGTGATIKLVSASDNIDSATVVATGSGYAIGDTITISTSVMEADGNIGSVNGSLTITLVADNLYSSSTYGSTNFELHPSEEVNLILSILGYAGVTIKDPTITQLTSTIQQSKEIIKQQ